MARRHEIQGVGSIASRFFLSTGGIREGAFKSARQLLAENLHQLRRLPPEPHSEFYAAQGVAFLRFQLGDFRRAARAAEEALRAALAARFGFGQAFASELLAHSRIQAGDISVGLKLLEQALHAARAIGHGGLAHSFEIARIAYLAQFGRPGGDVKELRELVARTGTSYSYSQGTLRLELARQLLLRGRLDEAKMELDAAVPVVHGIAHRRQSAVLSLRFAELARHRGDLPGALHFARMAVRELDPDHDRSLRVMALGLEAKLRERLGIPFDRTELDGLSASSTGFVARRIAARERGEFAAARRVGEDPIGDLLDSLRRGEEAGIDAILVSGFHGFLPEALGLPRDRRLIHVDERRGLLLVADRGGLEVSREPLPPLLAALLGALAGGGGKEDLVRALWGRSDYHPHRHDPALYRLIGRLRERLGSRASWIRAEDGRYRLEDGIAVSFAARDSEPALASPRRAEVPTPLNFRQLGVLERFARARFIDVEQVSRTFRTSTVTARRDLAALVRNGRLERIGSGRATKYIFPNRE